MEKLKNMPKTILAETKQERMLSVESTLSYSF